MIRTSALLAGLLLVPFMALADTPGTAHPCAALQQAAERLACYDRAFPPSPGSSAFVVDRQAERARAASEFGLTRRQVREADPQTGQVDDLERIESTVTRVGQTGEGKRVITLENGQTWLLTENTSRGDLRVGDRVTVRAAALASFMMVTPQGVALRARRTR